MVWFKTYVRGEVVFLEILVEGHSKELVLDQKVKGLWSLCLGASVWRAIESKSSTEAEERDRSREKRRIETNQERGCD